MGTPSSDVCPSTTKTFHTHQSTTKSDFGPCPAYPYSMLNFNLNPALNRFLLINFEGRALDENYLEVRRPPDSKRNGVICYIAEDEIDELEFVFNEDQTEITAWHEDSPR